MNIPCVNRLPFIVLGLSFLQPALTNAQFNNLTLIATALVLGAKFSLTQINLMWLKERSVSTLSWFMSDAKFSTREMMRLYALQAIKIYKITDGYFLIVSDMEGATIRSKQGVTAALCLVSWIDFLLHLENYKHCTAGELPQDSLLFDHKKRAKSISPGG